MADKDILDSWKEIAAYLHRSVRTCRNWEQRLGLPVHRLDDSPKARVFAYPNELDRWIRPFGKTDDERSQTRITSQRRLIYATGLAFIGIMIIVGILTLLRPSSSLDSIAVLPVINDSGDPALDNFADFLTESLISELHKVGTLRVAPRAAVAAYRNTPAPYKAMADAMHVKAFIEASVFKSGNRVRLTTRLTDPRRIRILWQDVREKDYADIEFLLSDLCRAIVAETGMAMKPGEEALLTDARRVNPDAYDAYLTGMLLVLKLPKFPDPLPETERCIAYFERALAIDPEFALAWGGLALTYDYRVMFRPGLETYPKAIAAAEEAIRLDATMTDPYVVLADAKMGFEWDWEGAEANIRLALAINPNAALAHALYGQLLAVMGRRDEAVGHAERALAIDPFSPTSWDFALAVYLQSRCYDRGIARTRDYLSQFPDYPNLHRILSMFYVEKGMLEEAASSYHRSVELGLWPDAWILAKLGRMQEVRQNLHNLIELGKTAYVDPYMMARSLASLGERADALEWLERASDLKSTLLVYVGVLPEWDPLRTDPKFRALLGKMGLDKYSGPVS
jgi:TolB-like protein